MPVAPYCKGFFDIDLLVIKSIYIYIYILYIKLNYKSHKRDFIKTSTVCFAFTAHQEVILIQIEFYLNRIQIEFILFE